MKYRVNILFLLVLMIASLLAFAALGVGYLMYLAFGIVGVFILICLTWVFFVWLYFNAKYNELSALIMED